jgi:hypothetical protein
MADFSGQSVNTSGFYKCGALWVSLLTSPANSLKNLPGSNTVAYSAKKSETNKKVLQH